MHNLTPNRRQSDAQRHQGGLEASGHDVRWRIEANSGANQHETYSRLVLERLEPSGSGLYECEVTSGSSDGPGAASEVGQFGSSLGNNLHHQPDSGHQQQAAGIDKLRRLFGLLVNGKYY